MKSGRFSGLLVLAGLSLPSGVSQRISLIGERISLGSWYKLHFQKRHRLVPHRFDLLKLGCERLKDDFAYLEFGVSSGNSMRFVSEVTMNLYDVELHGFDTFMGLPDSHHEKVMVGSFNHNGVIPEIFGVHWHVGFFDETFYGHESFLRRRLFLMFDADLYSSTKYVLNKVLMGLKPGDLMYFDDLHIPNQERLALTESITQGLNLSLIARSYEGRSALFEVLVK